MRMPCAVLDLVEEWIQHRLKKKATNFRQPLEVGLKLAQKFRHLATGETYKSLAYYRIVG